MAMVYGSSALEQSGTETRIGAGGPLPAGEARDPDPDRVVRPLAREDRGDHGGPNGVPRGDVAEEARDVDEDRVEELGELGLVAVQAGEVLRELRRLHGLHALGDAPSQGGALVAGEVEPSVVAYEVEDRLEA